MSYGVDKTQKTQKEYMVVNDNTKHETMLGFMNKIADNQMDAREKLQMVVARIEDSTCRIGEELAGFRTMMEKVLEKMLEQQTQEPRLHDPTEPTRSAAEAAMSKEAAASGEATAVAPGSEAGRVEVAGNPSRAGQGNVGPTPGAGQPLRPTT
ncbi:unnamed protein product [Linum trigynum]|uniref:Uncharacterized protein n=1 Tax=Linum trigynum TaxID=586398 RepID=A0AAV2F076_9ROSI